MKTHSYMLVLAVSVIAFAGCAQNKTRVAEGAGLGGLVGAGVGAIIGHQSGHGMEGALIGGAVGATGGGVMGSQMEKPGTTTTTTTSTTSVSGDTHVGLGQVIDWTQQGLSADDIITRINSSHSTYSLTSDDITYLRSKGVSERVIDAMRAAH